MVSDPTKRITHLEPNEVFVFGSNLAGKHGRGAAKDALKWGAVYGKGVGHYGQTYAIPTKDKTLNILPVWRIERHTERFIVYAYTHPELTFLVTEIGRGLAKYKAKDIAGLFTKAAVYCKNVALPKAFIEVLRANKCPINCREL